MFKKTLRRHLEKVFSHQELTRWFDPLLLQQDEEKQTIRVFFPHAFFRNWFLLTVRADFEQEAARMTNALSFVYEDMQQKKPVLEAPLSRHAQPFAKYQGDFEESDEQQSFDNFLINKKNLFPLNAAKKACAMAATGSRLPYTPIVFYGHSGSGKSHMLAAMAQSLRAKSLSVHYGDISYLDRLCISPGRYARASERCICLDDAQRLCVCTDLQDAMAALIDACEQSGTLLALAFDRHPSHIASLGQKVRSRLAGGLVAELKRPDLDVRLQYVHHVNAKAKLRLSKEQMLELCQHHHDIRAINGILTSFAAMNSLGDGPASAEAAFDELLPAQTTGKSPVTAATILQTVALHFRVNIDDLTGKKRDRNIAFARYTAIYLCRELLRLSLVQTGKLFSNRDHSSILYSLKKIKEIQESDKERNNLVEKLRQMCLGAS